MIPYSVSEKDNTHIIKHTTTLARSYRLHVFRVRISFHISKAEATMHAPKQIIVNVLAKDNIRGESALQKNTKDTRPAIKNI